jgi:hypothetical protein
MVEGQSADRVASVRAGRGILTTLGAPARYSEEASRAMEGWERQELLDAMSFVAFEEAADRLSEQGKRKGGVS